METHERLLTRLGFDIHDGPLQDLALLGEDVHLLRRQLSDVLAKDVREIMLGRLDDVNAQLVALDADLRRISASLQSPLRAHRALAEELGKMADAFAARAGIEAAVQIDGDLDELTDSQQIALLSIVRESLSNVRKHSRAAHVAITLAGLAEHIKLGVRDDGVGFDADRALAAERADHRFGLPGMRERTRLLGGSCRIDSDLGGTTISVTLPRWRAQSPDGA